MYVSSTGTVSSGISPLFVMVIANTLVSPTAAGRLIGYIHCLRMLTLGPTMTYGSIFVCALTGGSGAGVVGAAMAVLSLGKLMVLAMALKVTVTLVDCPTPSAPRFVQVSVPGGETESGAGTADTKLR